MVPADERGVGIGSGTSETERVAEDEPKLSGARGVANALVGDPSGELGSGWLGRDWLGKVGGCSLAVAGPSPDPNGFDDESVSKRLDAPELESSGGSELGNEFVKGLVVSMEGIDEGVAVLGIGELVGGSDLGVENGEGERSDGTTGDASLGSAFAEGNVRGVGAPSVDVGVPGKGLLGIGLGKGEPGSDGELSPRDGRLGPDPIPGGSASDEACDSLCCWLYATSEAGERNGFDGSAIRELLPSISDPGIESFPRTTGGGGGHDSGVPLKSWEMPSTVWFA
ncbi:hypothetical protein VN12_15555 [Pirellula sp. SH-Sr6A]|uniref:hypothetical protein n=1 Tax=Pirellula sp. SH-Sr6A TaxID=1632865 RepID=UPI00078DD072|nr:hypothetical protein [Pirellula sp. SH-Sr6A]AMV33542.1 hypothetical protein VN12_15555 [Pirellula sp. SH-Sr6A]